MKTFTVRWTACYETKLELPDNSTPDDIKAAAADIPIEVAGSEYQTDTWEVEKVVDNSTGQQI